MVCFSSLNYFLRVVLLGQSIWTFLWLLIQISLRELNPVAISDVRITTPIPWSTAMLLVFFKLYICEMRPQCYPFCKLQVTPSSPFHLSLLALVSPTKSQARDQAYPVHQWGLVSVTSLQLGVLVVPSRAHYLPSALHPSSQNWDSLLSP